VERLVIGLVGIDVSTAPGTWLEHRVGGLRLSGKLRHMSGVVGGSVDAI
jgi:hypothetical protein